MIGNLHFIKELENDRFVPTKPDANSQESLKEFESSCKPSPAARAHW